MRPTESTLKALIILVQKLVISEKTVLLYLYYCIHDGKSPTQKDIKQGTGLGLRTIRNHNTVLEALGAVERITQKGKIRRTEVKVFNIKPTLPSPSVLSIISNILNLYSQKKEAYRVLTGYTDPEEKKKGKGGRFTVMDICADDDWKKAKPVLEKYFKRFEIEPAVLTSKNRFAKLVELLLDDAIDFDEYCKWYYKEKYSDKGFNYGLFLYPNMIEEFKDMDDREGKYLRTSSRMATSESHKKGVAETKKFFESLPEDGV